MYLQIIMSKKRKKRLEKEQKKFVCEMDYKKLKLKLINQQSN